MNKYDDYEEDYNYEDEFDDAADDWEMEAEQTEEAQRAEEAAREARLEKKLATRAPIKKVEEVEEVVESDVHQMMEDMRQVASDIGRGRNVFTSESSELLGERKADTVADAEETGKLIAERLLEFKDAANFSDLMLTFLADLAKQFRSVDTINTLSSKARVAAEETKRNAKQAKKKVKELSAAQGDAMDFDRVVDRGGAAEVEDESPW